MKFPAQLKILNIKYFWLLSIILAPIPLGGNRIWAWSFLCAIFGMLGIFYFIKSNKAQFVAPPKIIIFAFFVCIAWLFVQALWSVQINAYNFNISMAPTDTLNGILRWGGYALVFFLSLQFGRSDKYTSLLLRSIAFSGALYALYGGYIYLSGNDIIPIWGKIHYLNDVTGTFINRNSYATYAGITSLLSLFWIANIFNTAFTKQSLSRLSDNRNWSYILQLMNIKTLFPVFCFIFNFAGLLMSHSRAGFLSFCAAVLFSLVVAFIRGNNKKPRIELIIIPFIALIGWMVVIGGVGTFERMSKVQNDWVSRTELYKAAGRGITQYPLTGTGLGTFKNAYHEFRDPLVHAGYNRSVVFAHNSYLQSALELGVPAAIMLLSIFLIIFFILIRGVWQRKRGWAFPLIGSSALILTALHAVVDFSIEMPAFTITLLAILGVSVAQSQSSRITLPQMNNWSRRFVLLLCFIITTFSAQLFMATKHLSKQELAINTLKTSGGTLSTAELSQIIFANQSALLWRNLPSLHQNIALAQMYLAEKNPDNRDILLKRAETHFRHCANLSPYDPFIWVQLAHVSVLLQRDVEIIAQLLENSFNTGMSEPLLMTYRLRLGLILWQFLTPDQKLLVKKQLPLAKHYAPSTVDNILKDFPNII